MFSRFAFYAGFRSFSARQHSRLVSFISMLAILGLVFGVSLLIVVFSVMNGFDHEMETRILGQVPHIRLFKAEGGVSDWQEVQQALATHPDVVSVQPYTRLEGLLSAGGEAVPVELEGLDLQQNPKVAQLIGAPVNDVNALYLAKGVADQLKLTVDQRVVLLVPNTSSLSSTGFSAQSFTVRGVFETKTALDQFLAITSLRSASGMAGFPDAVQGFQVQIADIFNSRNVGFDLLRLLPPGFSFNDWLQTHGNLYQAIKMSRNLVSLLVFLIIGIAVFNVVSMLVMTVVDKKSAIAIYKTLGASSGEIKVLFVVQGMLIGVVGTLLGSLVGVVLTLNLDLLVGVIELILQRPLLDPSVYPVNFLPVELRLTDILLIAGVSLVLNFVATLYPAWRASITQPAAVLSQD